MLGAQKDVTFTLASRPGGSIGRERGRFQEGRRGQFFISLGGVLEVTKLVSPDQEPSAPE